MIRKRAAARLVAGDYCRVRLSKECLLNTATCVWQVSVSSTIRSEHESHACTSLRAACKAWVDVYAILWEHEPTETL